MSILQRAKLSPHILAQSQLFPQLHSLPLFMGQFLPVFLQFGFSAANAVVQIIAARIDIRTFIEVFIANILILKAGIANRN